MGFAPRILHSIDGVREGMLSGGGDGGAQPAAAVSEHDKEHDRHRWVLLSLLTLWISVIVLAAARWLRLCSWRGAKRRPRRPGEPRSDLLHRF